MYVKSNFLAQNPLITSYLEIIKNFNLINPDLVDDSCVNLILYAALSKLIFEIVETFVDMITKNY